MASIDDFLGFWTIAEIKIGGERISPLNDPEPVMNPGDQIALVRERPNGKTVLCDLQQVRGGPKAPHYWDGVRLTYRGGVLSGRLPPIHGDVYDVTIRRFELAQPGRVRTGIECRYSEPGHRHDFDHMGVWHAPD